MTYTEAEGISNPYAPHHLIKSKKPCTDIYARIPPECEILLTHTPPYEVLDKTRRGKNAGCDVLAARLTQLYACRLHVFGHIHEAHGAVIEDGLESDDGPLKRVSVNAALAHDGRAIVVDLKN